MRANRRLLGWMLVLCGFTAVFGTLGAAEVRVTEENVTNFYRKFRRLTSSPHYVAPLTGILCRMPPADLIAKDKADTGPHFATSIHVYANEGASRRFAAAQPDYPAGSTFVKEKLDPENHPDGWGGMIKREPGYDPERGDWEYFYYDASAGFSTGRLAACADCHANAKETGNVFGTWNKSLR